MVDAALDARRIMRRATSRLRSLRYREADIQVQQHQLRTYTTGIVHVTPATAIESTSYAVFVHHGPNDPISASTLRALQSMRNRDVNVVFVANHELQASDVAQVNSMVHSIIVRNNQGFDFGAYKDVIAWLSETNHVVDRLLLANDSVFYASRGLDDLFAAMLGPEDVVAAHENWGEDHHLQSFLISMSGRVLADEGVQSFWENYAPVNNRVHAIEAGEKELSRVLLRAAESTRVVFSASRLYAALVASDVDLASRLIIYPNPWRTWVEALDMQHITRGFLINKIIDIVNVTSTIHAGAYLFPKALGSPLFKKDIVYRQRFEFWEVEAWLSEMLDTDETAEFLTCLRKKRDASALTAADRRRFDIGVR